MVDGATLSDFPRVKSIRCVEGHPGIVALASAISVANPELTREIKWNAPSFAVKGMNVVTFRLFPDPAFHIVLHVGSKKLVSNPDLRFTIEGLEHKWADSTRCVITVGNDANESAVNAVVKRWVEIIGENDVAFA
jgi:hypothetical protein